MISIRDILLVEYSFIGDFTKATSGIVVGIITFFAGVGLLIEVARRKDIFAYVQKVFVVILFIILFAGISISLIDKSFEVADYVAQKLSKHSLLLKGFNEALNEMEDKTGEKVTSTWKWIKYHILLGNELTTAKNFIILTIAKIMLFLVQAMYTTGYTITYGLIIFPCLLTLVHPFENALSGAIKTTAWCMVMPFVTLFLLFILSFHLTHSSELFDGFIVMLSFLAMLLGSGYLATKFIGGEGISGAASASGALIGSQLIRMSQQGLRMRNVGKWLNKSLDPQSFNGNGGNGGSGNNGSWWSLRKSQKATDQTNFSSGKQAHSSSEKDYSKELTSNLSEENANKSLTNKEWRSLDRLESQGHPVIKRAQSLANKANAGRYHASEWTKEEKGVAIMRARAYGERSSQWINGRRQYWGVVDDYFSSESSKHKQTNASSVSNEQKNNSFEKKILSDDKNTGNEYQKKTYRFGQNELNNSGQTKQNQEKGKDRYGKEKISRPRRDDKFYEFQREF